jgi:hypothetical protein
MKLAELTVAVITAVSMSFHVLAEDKQPHETQKVPPDSPTAKPSPATQEEIVQSFERKLKTWETFFKAGQVAFNKQHFPDSPTGYVFDAARYSLTGSVAYDVQKTDSLVSPYTGYMRMTLQEESTKRCGGNVRVGGDVYGWANLESLMSVLKESCYALSDILPYEEVQFNFALQRGHWIWKSAIRTKYGKPSIYISTALGDGADVGIPLPEQNKHWLALLED